MDLSQLQVAIGADTSGFTGAIDTMTSKVGAFSAIAGNMFEGLGQTIAATFTQKQNPLAALMHTIGEAVKALGKHLIEIGLVASTIGIGIPYVAAGVALEAIGAAMGSVKLASGGIVSGSTFANIGEYAGASHNPEVVAPLDKLKNMMGNNGPGGHYSFEIQGDRMVAIQQRVADNTNFALGGQ